MSRTLTDKQALYTSTTKGLKRDENGNYVLNRIQGTGTSLPHVGGDG